MPAPFSKQIQHPELTLPGWSIPFGPYFAAAAGAPDHDEGWMSVAELAASDAALRERATHAARTMGADPGDPRALRAAASTMALGLFARLLSPTLGAALLGESAPAPDPSTLWLRSVESGPIPLRTSAPLGAPDPWRAVTDVAVPLAASVRRSLGVSPHVLRGNIAAAVVGACDVVGLIRPDLDAAAADLRADLLARDPLRGTGTPRGPFRRTSCCLIYQLPMGYICSNCVLVAQQTALVRRRAAQVAGSPDFTYPSRPDLR